MDSTTDNWDTCHTETRHWCVKANLISLSDIKGMKERPKIQTKKSTLKDYNGPNIENFGTCRLVSNSEKKVQ